MDEEVSRRAARVSQVNLPVEWGEWHTPPASHRPAAPPLQPHVAEKFTGALVDGTEFAVPLRYMQHRAFRRSYLGSHRRVWSWVAAGGLFLTAAALNLVIYEATCHAGWWLNEGDIYGRSYYASGIMAALVFVLLCATVLLNRTPLAAKLTVYQSFVFMMVDLLCLVSLVVLATKANTSEPETLRLLWRSLQESVRSAIVSPMVPRDTHFAANSDAAISAATLLGLSCQGTQSEWFVWHWLVVAHLGIQTAIIVCDVIYSHIVGRIGAWYYLHSSWLVRRWRIHSVQTIRLLVPCSQFCSDMSSDYSKGSYYNRFEIKKGLRIEFVPTSLTVRLISRLISKCRTHRGSQHPEAASVARGAASDLPHTCVYTGQVNDVGLPQGFGYWRGDSVSGETLVGFWKGGVPGGPSKSREIASGSGLMCVKLGWARCILSERRMEYGAAKVECSVSGRFYRGFPEAKSENAPIYERKDSGLLSGAIKKIERMVENTKRVVRAGHPSESAELDPECDKARVSSAAASAISVPVSDTGDPGLPSSAHCSEMSREAAITVGPVPAVRRESSAGGFGSLIPLKRISWRKSRETRDDEQTQMLREARQRQVSRIYRTNIAWVLAQLRPHTPSFGLQARSELTITVDRERGLDIMGYVPEDQVVIDEGRNRSVVSRVSSAVSSPAMRVLQVKVLDRSVMHVGGEEHLPGIDVFMPELAVDGWVPMEAIGLSEVLVYVHGFNNSQQECQQTLGQMAAFGNFPTHLKIIVFAWPAGTSLWHFLSAQKSAEDPVCHEAFLQLLRALQGNGVRQLHILVHSMGSRLFLKSLRNILAAEDIFAAFPSAGDAQAGVISSDIGSKMQLLSATFMNPEYHLAEFVKVDYELLRSVCATITIYADGQDRALWWAEVFGRQPSLGRSVFGLRRGQPQPSQAFLINPSESSGSSGSSWDNPLPPGPRMMHTISLFQLDDVPRGSPMGDANRPSNYYWTQTPAEPGEWMDLDIIDTTFMDRNINIVRHSFWNLNREIIEDLRELLVTRKRARQRAGRLDHRDGNVWVFRVAPSFLTSIFDDTF